MTGDADKTGSGDIRLEALYNFNTESVHVPAFSLAGGVELPTGKDTEGIDTTVKFIASKMPFPKSYLLHRVHLNIIWRHDSERKDDERSDYYKAILGFSSRVGKDTMLVFDILREQERKEKEEANIFEVGIRRQLDPLTVIVVGGGAGLGDESPDMRLTFGFQRSF